MAIAVTVAAAAVTVVAVVVTATVTVPLARSNLVAIRVASRRTMVATTRPRLNRLSNSNPSKQEAP